MFGMVRWRAKISIQKPKPQSTLTLQNLFNLNQTRPISALPSQCLEEEDQQQEEGKNSKRPPTHSLSDHPNPEFSCFHQKGFSQITNRIAGKALHAFYIVRGLTNLDVFYDNTLVNMYSKFGDVGLARYVFDKMPQRNEASWNNMISGFVRTGLLGDAFGFFREMMGLGVLPSGFAVSSLLAACERSGFMFDEGEGVHGFVVKSGLLSDVFVGTSLLHFYGSYGFGFAARKVFEEMPEKNVVSWTALMVACIDGGNPREVISLYLRMRRGSFSCNANNLSTVISACGSIDDRLLGYQILGHVIKFGLEMNVSVANSLVSMFGNFGSISEACYVFGGMNERDTISWNALISAYAHNDLCEESLWCFNWMRCDHGEINSSTLSAVLSSCGSVDSLKWARGIHGLVVKYGLDLNICVCNTLLGMYSSAGETEDAEFVFHGMMKKDSISWNSMVACYAQNGRCHDALKILATMSEMGQAADYVTFTSALAACSDPEYITEGMILHSLAVVKGLLDNLIVGNALVTFYSKSGMMTQAKKVLKMLPNRDEVTWNAVISGHADNEEPDEALETFKLMRKEGVLLNYITIVNLLGASVAPYNLLKHGMPIHALVILMGFEFDRYVQNSLIAMYAKCGDVNSSRSIFNRISQRDEIAWNAIMAANAHHGLVEEALKLLVEMRRAGVGVGQFSFSESLAAAAKLAILEEGQQLHGLAVKHGFDSDPFVINATMDMYGKCGEMEDVLRLVPEPFKRSQLSWNILLSSFTRNGHFGKALEIFYEMIEQGVKPDHVTFVSLLSACSHGGLVGEGLAFYNAMTKKFGVPAAIEHCVCIVDLLGRAGRLTEAEVFIQEMPVPPTDLVWRSLLAACRMHGNRDIGIKAAENLINLDRSDDSAYVLYSNVCASTGRWEEVETVRSKMESNNIYKQPACSWVKFKTKWSSFGMGDKSHPQTSHMYQKLEELKNRIHEAGYVADTSYSLQDTDEEQKEHNLWNHSERLALAFGLINTPEGSTVKIFKNLRVCGDCHSVFKLLSGILGRKIVLRDPFRFHHFSGGTCSCSDYW